MKMQIKTLVLLCFIPWLFISCATRQDVQTLDFRMRFMDNKMSEIDQALQQIADKTKTDLAPKKSVEQVQKQQASTGETLERLHADMLQIMAAIDELAHKVKMLEEENLQMHESSDETTDELQSVVDDLRVQAEKIANEVNEIKIARAQEASDRALAAAKAAQLAKEKAAQASGIKQITPRKTKVSKSNKSDEPGLDLYDEAYTLYTSKKYREAFRSFSKYIDAYPKGSMVPNSRFWLADSLYNQKEYELAILEYQKVIDSFPKHDKAPAALLKEGYAFEKLKDNETAKIVYEKLLAEYPQSDQADQAKKRLEKIK